MKAIYKSKRFQIYVDYEKREYAKSIGGRWNGSLKCWTAPFTIDNYERLKAFGFDMSDQIHDYFKTKLEGIANLPDLEMPVKSTPYAHQKHWYNMGLAAKRCLFLGDVGTGKSMPSIAVATKLYLDDLIKKVLIICPATLRPNWLAEIEKHSDFEGVDLSGSLEQRRDKLKNTSVLFYIVNYEILFEKLEKDLLKQKFDMIIFDEISYLKSRVSQRSRACWRLCKDIEYKIGLTGTLIANRPDDIFMPEKIIDSTIFGESYTRFKEKFLWMGGFVGPYGPTQVLGVLNEPEYRQRLALNSLRYKLDDVKDMPPEIEVVREFELGEVIRGKYKECEADIITYQDIETAILERKVVGNVLEKIIRYSQISSGFIPLIKDFQAVKNQYVDVSEEKLNELFDVIEEIEGKFIIWCRFTHSIDNIAKRLRKAKISYYQYDGRTKDKDLYLKFNKDDTRCWLAQIATGIGYSIPRAKHAVFYELSHDATHWTQSKGRNRRIEGSDEGSCVYIYLQAKDTLDGRLFKALKKKAAMAERLLGKGR